MIVSRPPTSLPAAMERIAECERQIRELKQALRFDLIPAWVIQDVLDENVAMKEALDGKTSVTGECDSDSPAVDAAGASDG